MGSQVPRAPVVFAVETLAVAACYYVGGRLGLLAHLSVGDAVFSPIWPPTGIAVAALLFFGLRCWVGIALGSFHLSTPGFIAGNVAAPVCGYLLLRRVGFHSGVARLRDCVFLVFLGGFSAMLISSTVGVGLLVATGDLPSADFWGVWLAWWVGDAMGVLLVTPLLLVLRRARAPVHWKRWMEAAGFGLVTVFLVPVATRSPASVLFTVYPLLIWAALRFQLAGSVPCALFASVLATVAAVQDVGPFDHLSDVQTMLNLQSFNGAMALTALLLSAVITEQHNTRRSVEQACQELVEVLEHLTAGESTAGRSPREEDGRSRNAD